MTEAKQEWTFEKHTYTAVTLSQLPEDKLLDLHNRLAKYLGNEERAAFPSRKLAEGAIVSQLRIASHPATAKAPKGEKPTKVKPPKSAKADAKENEMTKSTKKSTARRATAPSKERRQRNDFSGKHLKAAVKENPRREGTDRHKAMELIMKAGAKGILFEDFVKKGGSHGLAQGALNKGFIKVS